MKLMYKRCCGLDVHKKTVVACVQIREEDTVHKEIQTFPTMTSDLLILHDWLVAHGVTHVAMESTGVYWEAHLQSPGSQFRDPACQCGSCEGGSGAQDRRQRL